jgi:hypothetical protein
MLYFGNVRSEQMLELTIGGSNKEGDVKYVHTCVSEKHGVMLNIARVRHVEARTVEHTL